jgi:hypothetical protein
MVTSLFQQRHKISHFGVTQLEIFSKIVDFELLKMIKIYHVIGKLSNSLKIPFGKLAFLNLAFSNILL